MKYSLKKVFLLVAILGCVFGAMKLWWIHVGEGRVARVTAEIKSIESVQDVATVGFWDSPFEYKIVEVHIQLDGGGFLLIGYPTMDLRTDFRVHQVGHHGIKFAPLSPSWFHYSQFGTNGDLTSLMPRGFASVHDLIENYDEVAEVVRLWPNSKATGMQVQGKGGEYVVWKEPI